VKVPAEPGWWHKGFPDGLGVRQQWLDRVEFAGIVANGRAFRGTNGRWVTFLTLGTGYGEYIDVTVQRPVAYRDYDIVYGQGRIRTQDRSDYIHTVDTKCYTFKQWGEINK
jgi:hypothetical protein